MGVGREFEEVYRYNLARYRHFLGMAGKAKRGYEEVIGRGEDRERRLAAYNLCHLLSKGKRS